MRSVKEILKKVPFLVSAKIHLWRLIFRKQERERAIASIILPGISRDVAKALFLQEMSLRSPTDGVIVECGVATGKSLGILGLVSDKKIYGFDSFEGFPKGTDKDSASFNPDKKWLYKLMEIDVARNNIIRMGVKPADIDSRILFVKGFFPDSFKGFKEEVALLHLDVDLYQSYKDCLSHFFPLLTTGGVILFDEYDGGKDLQKWPGAKIAIDEFLGEHNLSIRHHWSGFTYVQKP
jgi:O-methyltransferase